MSEKDPEVYICRLAKAKLCDLAAEFRLVCELETAESNFSGRISRRFQRDLVDAIGHFRFGNEYERSKERVLTQAFWEAPLPPPQKGKIE